MPFLHPEIPHEIHTYSERETLVYTAQELIAFGILHESDTCEEEPQKNDFASMVGNACSAALRNWVGDTLGGFRLETLDMCWMTCDVAIQANGDYDHVKFGALGISELDEHPSIGLITVGTTDCTMIDYPASVEALEAYAPGLGWNAYWAFLDGVEETLGCADFRWAADWKRLLATGYDEEGKEIDEEAIVKKEVAKRPSEIMKRVRDVAFLQSVVDREKDSDEPAFWKVATLSLKIIKALEARAAREDALPYPLNHNRAEGEDTEVSEESYRPVILATASDEFTIGTFDDFANALSGDGSSVRPIWQFGFSQHSEEWTFRRALFEFAEWFEIVKLCDELAQYLDKDRGMLIPVYERVRVR